MVYCQGIPAYTGGGKIINRPVVAQFNSVTELSLVQGELVLEVVMQLTKQVLLSLRPVPVHVASSVGLRA